MKYLRKYVIITLSLLFACFQVKAQENEKKLVPFAEIFTDFQFPPGDVLPWNNGRDGKLIILGAQRTLGRNARMAIDYQAGIPNDINKMASDMIYLHAHFRF